MKIKSFIRTVYHKTPSNLEDVFAGDPTLLRYPPPHEASEGRKATDGLKGESQSELSLLPIGASPPMPKLRTGRRPSGGRLWRPVTPGNAGEHLSRHPLVQFPI
ncbi:MAG: hypothetical protein COT81_02010 [Candidatus Buchananbacteria bacterium CG10_big_fil_rev_8_21_14_0_10_42_9]|uniref:Uncharacterized protein n=1 Tax=Candidatus Buchananbacteria bacterium CG10_big_fil_rev_8_21_14_0_10_42_9 TaxID=1974526 RepID=A0A2H0W1Q6_9BACT|nr:MAG: hypothetical protein COT81_02010 [Candidatus Buchananbacteria bacterium CG10_big_fil_rev_8_21_14_0_10_42_9]